MATRFRSIRVWLIAVLLFFAALFAFAYIYAGGFILHYAFGGKGWPEVSTTDFRLSHAMRRAWEATPPDVKPGAFEWQELAPGYEIAEMPVLTDREEIDRFYLVRLDPAHYTFSVHARSGTSVSQWEKALPDAALIVNGSFFGARNEPDTPFIINGVASGPATYDARAGAFVANDVGASVVDLSDGRGWEAAFVGARNAMVAYPLLIGEDGLTHVSSQTRWLSNRTFVAEDKQGRIVIGSTKEAFFSLNREAEFLKVALPDLKVALNLDGGPVASQSVRVGTVHRLHIARWEAQEENGRARLIHLPFGEAEMPIVLAASPRPVETSSNPPH